MSQKILVAEDNEQIGQLLVRCLLSNRFQADLFENGAQAMEKLRQTKYDLLILDWELPELSGIAICKNYRQEGGLAPVLMLTGRRELDDKESGFTAGADDYLTKPFSTREVIMRVEALLRRPALVNTSKLQAGNLILEPAAHRVTNNGDEIRLSRQEFALLEFFVRHPNEAFDSEALLARVWAADSDAGIQTVANYITRLRKKLDKTGQPSMLETVHGVGYRLRSS